MSVSKVVRYTTKPECADENERLIRDLQTSTGFDSYWKVYFLLTGGGAK